jgi:hypothetical protein
VLTGISAVILAIVAISIVLGVIGNTAATVNNAADDITQDARCADAGCFYNASSRFGNLCQLNNASQSGENDTCAGANTNKSYPLEGLFNTGGIVILLFIAAALIVSVGLLMNMYKKK